MAATPGTAKTSLEQDLLCRGHEFSFFQAMRLLFMIRQESGCPGPVRVRPALDLSFPQADIERIEKEAASYLVTATFLGLYGPASPLPTFYTEELLAESAADLLAAKGFLDVINQHIFDLFHKSTLKYRLFHQIAQLEQTEYLERLFCLTALGGEEMRRQLHGPQSLLRYAPIISLQQRSALGLSTLLTDLLQVPVEVIQCVTRRVVIPPEQRPCIGISGCNLGSDAVLGCEVLDRNGTFLLRLGPLTEEQFETLLPGTPDRSRLESILRYYLHEPIAWDLEMIQASAVPIILGSHTGTRLGWDSRLPSVVAVTNPSVIFPYPRD